MTPPPLSARLRTATAALHRQAERAGIMPALLRGQLPRAGYVQLLRQLQALYAALEAALGGPGAPPVPAALHRGAALQADLAVLAPGVAAEPLRPATEDYVRHLAALAAQDPLRLAAHAYVRYLGDLAGGQVLAGIAGRCYGLTPEAGLRFYDFGPVDRHAALAAAVRNMLDSLPASAGHAVVDEAQSAFGRHVRLFEELAASPAG